MIAIDVCDMTCKWTGFPHDNLPHGSSSATVSLGNREYGERKGGDVARGFIGPHGINSVPACLEEFLRWRASFSSAQADCGNLSHCHDAALALDDPPTSTCSLAASPRGNTC